VGAASRALAATTRAIRSLGLAPAAPEKKQLALAPPAGRGGWWPIVRESFAGAWQQNVEVRADLVTANWAVFACITLIASDIGKLRLRLVQRTEGGIWEEAVSPAFSPVLRRPNRYQTRQKFIEQWIISKLVNGNAYVLKRRDDRGVVVELYVLDPNSVRPLVAPDGSVFYQLNGDDLSRVPDGLPAVPASEIIHDTMVCLFHPLVGVSPIYACGLAATQALKIQNNSALFFQNMSRPSGVLTAPGQINDETAKRLKDYWEENYTGDKIGKVAVLGDALKYEAMTVNAEDSQLVEQLKLTAEMICACYHVPAFKIGAGTIPAGQKVEDLNQIYYSDCLQAQMESVEAHLDYGLGLDEPKDGRVLGTEFDLDELLKMDSATKTSVLKDQVGAGITSPNEARRRLNLGPTAGGQSPKMQQQNYSLSALDQRDSGPDPFGKAPAPAAAPAPAPAAEPAPAPDVGKELDALRQELSSLGERARDAEVRELAAGLIQRFSSDAHTLA